MEITLIAPIKIMDKLRFIYIEQTHRLWKSVKSTNPCKSLPFQAGVIQTSYDIMKAHGRELKVESLAADQAGEEGEGTEFIIQIPVKTQR